jgi:hypothetical protein
MKVWARLNELRVGSSGGGAMVNTLINFRVP